MLLAAALVAILCFCSSRNGGRVKNGQQGFIYSHNRALDEQVKVASESSLLFYSTFSLYNFRKSISLFESNQEITLNKQFYEKPIGANFNKRSNYAYMSIFFSFYVCVLCSS